MGGASGCLADGALFERVHTLACLVKMEKKMHLCGLAVRVAGTRFYAQHLLRAAAACCCRSKDRRRRERARDDDAVQRVFSALG